MIKLMISIRNSKVGKLQRNQKGFSAVEGILVLVILGIVGFTGNFVWHAKESSDKNLTINNSTTPTFKKQTKPSAPNTKSQASLTMIKSSDGFSFSYPSNGWDVTAYGTDENVNGGQVAPSDPTAVQWRITKSVADDNASLNAMCVDITTSTVSNAGISYTSSPGKIVSSGNSNLQIWRINDTSNNPNQNYGAVTVLESPGSGYVKLTNGKAVTAFASFVCAQKMTTTYTYNQQITNQDYLSGIDILKSLSLN